MTRRRRTDDDMRAGRLRSRPAEPGQARGAPGLHRLGLGDAARDGLLYVPESCAAPAPLLVMFHGAGGDAQQSLDLVLHEADARGLVVLAPDSRGPTWDVLLGGFGDDLAFLDAALADTFTRYDIDPRTVAVGGFSDGASYALSVGLTNGDVTGAIVAFSPGFAAPAAQRGAPRVFISHGKHDRVLPIDATSRRLVPALRGAGYDVHALEYDAAHTVPRDIVNAGITWLLGTPPRS